MMYSGHDYTPVFDNLMGVFCWMRKADGGTTPWETGHDALDARAYALTPREPEKIDETARLAFEAAGIDPIDDGRALCPRCGGYHSGNCAAVLGPREFAFDVKLFATFRVTAQTEARARAMLDEALDAADTNFGAWPNGDPILAEASIDGPADLIEIDGEAV